MRGFRPPPPQNRPTAGMPHPDPRTRRRAARPLRRRLAGAAGRAAARGSRWRVPVGAEAGRRPTAQADAGAEGGRAAGRSTRASRRCARRSTRTSRSATS
ncbi:MAG: hypothetical protein MZV64_20950 [Ignavibacteriales bacterium]|nr:hypothetical protein [Ignavibacteriales bacterium]